MRDPSTVKSPANPKIQKVEPVMLDNMDCWDEGADCCFDNTGWVRQGMTESCKTDEDRKEITNSEATASEP